MEYKVVLLKQNINQPVDEVSLGEHLVSKENEGRTQK